METLVYQLSSGVGGREARGALSLLWTFSQWYPVSR